MGLPDCGRRFSDSCRRPGECVFPDWGGKLGGFASGGSVNSGRRDRGWDGVLGERLRQHRRTPNNKFYAFEVTEDHGKHTDNGRKNDGSKGHNSAP